ncbi:ABC transporter [Nocardioides daphniae]|uniref:ABC transporter n=1 Tax=Nocardioides daphniae TaxID=402297 RepID=UPI001EE8EC77|nr:ABC transporter [Nocardioides daphniae]
MLSVGNHKDELDGVILLDLPDHDSTEVSHHLEVDRLVQLADMLIWVLDPQKYADAAIHDRYLSQLTGHQDVMLVVLNQIDRVPAERRDAMVEDVRRLLAADGLTGVPVVPVSSREGWGVAELRSEIAKKVASKKVAKARLEADLRTAATTLQGYTGTAAVPTLSPERVEALEDAFADAAGVPTVVKAVEDSTRLRANRATGWPVTSWLSRFKPDPLKRLHLDLGAEGKMLTGAARTSVPEATQVQRARVDSEVRALVDDVTTGFKQNWAHSVRVASVSRLGDVNDRLDRELATTDLGVDRIPIWASAVRVLQWMLILSAVAGAAWIALLTLGTAAGLTETETPEVAGWPIPLLLLGGGIGLGVVLALVCRVLVHSTAKRRARVAEQRLRSAIHEVPRTWSSVPCGPSSRPTRPPAPASPPRWAEAPRSTCGRPTARRRASTPVARTQVRPRGPLHRATAPRSVRCVLLLQHRRDDATGASGRGARHERRPDHLQRLGRLPGGADAGAR